MYVSLSVRASSDYSSADLSYSSCLHLYIYGFPDQAAAKSTGPEEFSHLTDIKFYRSRVLWPI